MVVDHERKIFLSRLIIPSDKLIATSDAPSGGRKANSGKWAHFQEDEVFELFAGALAITEIVMRADQTIVEFFFGVRLTNSMVGLAKWSSRPASGEVSNADGRKV